MTLAAAEQRAQLMRRLQGTCDVAEVEACLEELGELRSSDEYATARSAWLRSVASEVEKQNAVDEYAYRAAAGFVL